MSLILPPWRLISSTNLNRENVLVEREAAFARVETALGLGDLSKIPRRYTNMDRIGTYHRGLEFGTVLMQEQLHQTHGVFDPISPNYCLITESPLGPHFALFLPALRLLASADQLEQWLELAETGQILGTYCQTELGHGTFVRGLETTATFCIETDEFIINSPTLTSTKFWPGALGFTCTHAIVMARLIAEGKDYGIHAFLVQLRSPEDFSPLQGVELGDIGLNMGFNATDNGYVIFRCVHIPRTNMLMRHAKLTRNGIYVKPIHEKYLYQGMVFSRSKIVYVAALQLAQASTIAIRYSVVREQGIEARSCESGKEVSVLSYRSQHSRLFTQMARAFALLAASKECEEISNDFPTCRDVGTIAYSHMTIAGMKAYSTHVSAEGAEDCRKCCGGHGYSVLSGLPDIVTTAAAMTTFEGENFVMLQQVARYLMKIASAVRGKTEQEGPMKYLADGFSEMYPKLQDGDLPHKAPARLRKYDLEDDNLVSQLADIITDRAVHSIIELESTVWEARQASTKADVVNTYMMESIEAAWAHIERSVFFSFKSAIHTSSLPLAERDVLQRLCALLGLEIITTPAKLSPSFLEHTSLTRSDLKSLRALKGRVLTDLLPDAIALTDSWWFTDGSLASALGVSDGNVYETLMSWVKQLPINQLAATNGGVDREGFQKYIKPGILSKWSHTG